MKEGNPGTSYLIQKCKKVVDGFSATQRGPDQSGIRLPRLTLVRSEVGHTGNWSTPLSRTCY
jgi:hypothetical protein